MFCCLYAWMEVIRYKFCSFMHLTSFWAVIVPTPCVSISSCGHPPFFFGAEWNSGWFMGNMELLSIAMWTSHSVICSSWYSVSWECHMDLLICLQIIYKKGEKCSLMVILGESWVSCNKVLPGSAISAFAYKIAGVHYPQSTLCFAGSASLLELQSSIQM